MKDRARCRDCKWLGKMLPDYGKYRCEVVPKLVRPHWLACEDFDPREKEEVQDAISSSGMV